jgi:hypothetical protein
VPAHLDITGYANQSDTSILDGEAVPRRNSVAWWRATARKPPPRADNVLDVFSSRRNTCCAGVKAPRERAAGGLQGERLMF